MVKQKLKNIIVQKKEEEQETTSLNTFKGVIVSFKDINLFNSTIDQSQLAMDFRLKILLTS